MESTNLQNYNAWSLALKIHELSEVGSAEFKSSELIENILEKNGFKVERGYKGIPTSFRAEMTAGNGKPTIAFLAEYDALLGIGHACGHNLIAAANVFAAIDAAQKIKNGKIVVIGTPDEEGTGDYSGSKILLADRGSFNDIDLVLGAHPGSEWNVASQALAVQDVEVTFKGRSSHEAANPEQGRSALDAAVLTYTAVNMLRQHVRRDANVVMHGVIREGGGASNVTPDRSVLVFGIRSSDLNYHSVLMNRFENIVKGCCIATETEYTMKRIGPLFSTVKVNRTLSDLLRDIIVSKGIDVPAVEESLKRLPGGSTDFANVTQVVPALEIHFQIAPSGTPWHSRQSLEAARSSEAKKPLANVIEVLSEAAQRYMNEPDLRKKIRNEFDEHPVS
ncbi:M20 family metallopeptidase [Oxyplasma meridianum]|uniref:Peptidase M20 domain-containing protein 2 n=1 Tax=Oxyplasma meridianum TaxID=3073602 RepID=A0AAX4NG46_9ARCH